MVYAGIASRAEFLKIVVHVITFTVLLIFPTKPTLFKNASICFANSGFSPDKSNTFSHTRVIMASRIVQITSAGKFFLSIPYAWVTTTSLGLTV